MWNLMEPVSEIEPTASRHRANGRAGGRDPKARKSRITNGKVLLPTASGSSIWARLVRDTLGNLMSHLGGADLASETQKLAARRVSVLESELIYLEDYIATERQEGREPDDAKLDLYGRLADRQRRLADPLGWQRTARVVGQSLGELLQQDHARQQLLDVAQAAERRREFEAKRNAEQQTIRPSNNSDERMDVTQDTQR